MADGLSDVFAVEPTEVRKQVQAKADRLIADSPELLTFLDVAVLGRLPGASRMDGLPAALSTVVVHFLVVVVLGCGPLYLVAWLQVRNSTFRDVECAALDVASGRCSPPSVTLSVFGMLLSVVSMAFMLFYTIVDYLARQIDFLIFDTERRGPARLSEDRRRLLRIRASPCFRAVFWTLSMLLVSVSCLFATAFCLYITLGACVDPNRLLPILLAVIAVAVVAKSTYSQLCQMQQALRARLDRLQQNADDLVAVSETAEGALRELGLNSTQILLFTLAVCVAFAAFVTFLLLGCMMFIAAESFVPTMISSGMVLLSTAAMVQSGKVSGAMASSNAATAQLSGRLAEVSTWSKLMTEASDAKESKAALVAAQKLEKQKAESSLWR